MSQDVEVNIEIPLVVEGETGTIRHMGTLKAEKRNLSEYGYQHSVPTALITLTRKRDDLEVEFYVRAEDLQKLANAIMATV